ncbi:site-specific DNA-methyltransferase [Clostridium botulinum]|nr:site-specific DNA-methyltransferase [Clostridium botulinum]
MEKMNGKTLDIVADNIAKLKEIFPEVFNEDKVDFEKLENVLGEYKDNGTERYNFSWPGKSKAIRIAQTPSTGTLRPCKEESKNWDETGNLYIKGDNLEVLKILQKSYYGKVKMIYIDPPYNTGNDFVYKDDFKDNVENYLAITGQKDEEGNKTTTNTESNGRYHTNWLNMMYPRLKLARNLLKDDGVIFISIDDKEVTNLKKICDEIFGEDNYIECLKWKKKKQPSFLAKHTAKVMEYILVYAKNGNNLEKLSIENLSDATKKVVNISNNEVIRKFKKGVRVKIGENGVLAAGRYKIKTMEVEYLQDVVFKKGVTINEVEVIARFSVSQEKIDEFIEDKLLFITGNNGLRRYVSEEEKNKRKSITDLLLNEYGDNQDSDNEFKELFKEKYFDYTKPIELVYNFVKSNFTKEEVILDFFSGSCTTAHAVMKLNCEDSGNRKFIMVQLPELTDKKSEAYKAGYENICEIGKERIRRAGDKIKEENKDKEGIEDLDIGFKVFKLDSSNINKWEPAYEQNLESTLLASIENIKNGRSEEDILYEILLKYGIDLNMPIEEHIINDKKVFDIGFGAIIACLDKDITLELVEGIGKLKEQLEPDTCRVVFMDNGFSSDSIKTNAVQILKRYNIEDVKCI